MCYKNQYCEHDHLIQIQCNAHQNPDDIQGLEIGTDKISMEV